MRRMSMQILDHYLVKHKGAWLPLCMFPTDQQFGAIHKFPLNDEDIMVVTFPRSGCTPITIIIIII